VFTNLEPTILVFFQGVKKRIPILFFFIKTEIVGSGSSFQVCITEMGTEPERNRSPAQRCAGAGVQESTPAGVGVFQQKSEQNQEWIFSIGTGAEQE